MTIDTGSLEGVKRMSGLEEANTLQPEMATATAAVTTEIPLPCRILLPEDGPDNQRLISFVLKKAGAKVTIAADEKAAVELATAAEKRGEHFHVILMDMQMPVMDGYEATKALRKNGYTRAIVALTARAMAGERTKCLEAGCDDYATEPIERSRLTSTIRRHLQTSRTPAEVTD